MGSRVESRTFRARSSVSSPESHGLDQRRQNLACCLAGTRTASALSACDRSTTETQQTQQTHVKIGPQLVASKGSQTRTLLADSWPALHRQVPSWVWCAPRCRRQHRLVEGQAGRVRPSSVNVGEDEAEERRFRSISARSLFQKHPLCVADERTHGGTVPPKRKGKFFSGGTG